jgi:acyl-coenzyme A thioesterase PaaI-like protein
VTQGVAVGVASVSDNELEPGPYCGVAQGATQEFKLNLLAPVRDGTVSAEAHIMSMSNRAAVVRIEATNEGTDGSHRLVALAQGTVSLQAPRA